jgi:NAD(P)-dependent dehydrogenase (short-subunit alcohol dehydrogenase family)
MGILDSRGNLKGKTAIIIGGADGIGKAVTLALAEAEIRVAFCDINADAVKTTRAELESMGNHPVAEVADAIDPPHCGGFMKWPALLSMAPTFS